MKTKVLGIVTIGLFGCSALFAATSELRSPNFLQRGDVLHYMLDPVDTEGYCQVEVWGAGYCRNARRAYIPECDEFCAPTNNTTKTQELATLFFGKDCFLGEEAFAGGILLEPSGNAALSLSKICPRFRYTEKGAYFGVHARHDFCDSCWHVGGRASLPVKVIDVEQQRSCGSETPELDMGDVIVRRQEIVEPRIQGNGADMLDVNAYRLDFLSTLKWIDGTPLINYGNGAALTMVAGERINAYNDAPAVPIPAGTLTTAPMYVISSQSGKISDIIAMSGAGALPSTNNLAQDVPPDGGNLPASGVTGDNGERYQFLKANNYANGLAVNRDAQSKLFLIPNANTNGGQILIPQANIVQNAVDYVLNQQDLNGRDSAIQYFKDHDVDFCQSQRVSGFGDLYAEFYTGYQTCNWFMDGLVGLTFPTGKTSCKSGYEPYYQPVGNNGHGELRAGLEGGWQMADWFAFRTMVSFNKVFQHTDRRAPYFEGATIRNVPAGDPICVKVDWNYFWGNFDLNFFVPNCPDCGFTIGYEVYAKGKDNVCFCSSEALDFVGKIHKLSECLATQKTDTRTHKIRGEFFHRCGCCQYFIGGSWVFAGHYAMKESSAFGGVVVYF